MIPGNTVVVTGTFTLDDVPDDPDVVTLEVRSPGGPTLTYTLAGGEVVSAASPGVFTCNVDQDEAGRWVFVWEGVWEGASPVKVAVPGFFQVEPSPLA